jgi:PAS domain S-box-containing protein
VDPERLLERSTDLVTAYDREARLVYMNDAAVRPFGRAREELLGKRPWELVPAGPPTKFRIALEAVIAGGAAQRVLSLVPGIDRWYETDIYPDPDGAFAISRDVTETQRALEAARASERRFRAMVEFAPEAIVLIDPAAQKFRDANEQAAKMFGRSREELLTIGPLDLFLPGPKDDPDNTKRAAERAARVLAGETVQTEWQVRGAGGKTLTVETRSRVLPETDPPIIRTSLFDVSARKRAQDRLTEVQRLEAIARLAGGVAHDFNNMLTVILGGTQVVLRDLPPGSGLHEMLDSVVDAAMRASLVTRQLLAFARKQEVSPIVLDLSAYIERMKPVLGRIVGEDIEVDFDLARPLSGVLLDPAHIEQILLNLAANARDAMPRGGRLSVHTANVFLDAEYERIHNVAPGRHVMLTVADTGEGIPDAVKPHIFEPFFTTKGLERGTGLGLATVHGIVQQNRGHIWVYSEPGMGTTFKVYFPAVEGAVTATEPSSASAPGPSGTETVLLVEDEDQVRRFMRRALERAGYTVLEARNAGEALLIFEQHETPIHLLVTDVVMPRMTGVQLADRLRRIRAELPVVFVSGYSHEHLSKNEIGPRDGFIAKPMTVDALLRCVRDLLERTS